MRTVRYVVPHGEIWPEGHREDRVHEVDMAVEFIMDDRTALSVSWAMDGLNEGLQIGIGNPEGASIDLFGDAVDVSGHADWKRFIGASIESIAPIWHVPNEGCPEMPWAFRFGFSNGSHPVIALGETNGPRITYTPDALVVIFDKGPAVAYRIPASTTSSYG